MPYITKLKGRLKSLVLDLCLKTKYLGGWLKFISLGYRSAAPQTTYFSLGLTIRGSKIIKEY